MFCQPCNMVESSEGDYRASNSTQLPIGPFGTGSGDFFQKCFVAPVHLLVTIFDVSTSISKTFDTL